MAHDSSHAEIERQLRQERVERFGRIRRLLRPLPRRANVARYPVLRHFSDAARRNPHLWSFQRKPVRTAIYVGALIAFLPIYGLQLLLGLGAAMLFRANLAIVCAFQLITNPVTAGPLYYLSYRIGHEILHTLELSDGQGPVGAGINALMVGGIVLGLVTAVTADLAYRFIMWEARQLRIRHQAARERAAAAAESVGIEAVTDEVAPASKSRQDR
ncbi:MAG: DUF2062 domain-containing protein [Acidobacteriota bacterium]